ncbi:MAG TPA: ATP-dependent DNA helicase RecG [Vicinamibacterales bacterium]|nr:ATP-dependent DNA helicase RecG [Vicinamibacterales bacterium]
MSSSRPDWLSTPLQFIKGVGPRRAGDLSRVGLETVEDFLLRFPMRYEDRARLTPVVKLRPGTTATVVAEVLSSGLRSTRRPGFRLFELIVKDETGPVRAVFPNQPFLRDVFHPGQQVVLYGPLEFRGSGGLQFTNPEFEIIRGEADEDDATVHTGRIVPIYEKIGTLTPRVQRTLMHRLLAEMPASLPDPVPMPILERHRFPSRREAIAAIHFPPAGETVEALNARTTLSQRRLIFEEFFLFQAGLVLRKRRMAADRKPVTIVVDDRIRESARRALPFKLTAGQKDALREIVGDLQRPQPMNRLLQGDVGAGKTVVAVIAAIVAMENGLQVAFMAPTEILADQHYLTLRRLLDRSTFRIAQLTGSTPAARRREVLAELASGTVNLAVGTHALAEEAVGFNALGLVIIDEQHRFGVEQRATLRSKGLRPDVLIMTATPIPRTLGLTVFGDLDVSVIRDLPPGRQPITTVARPESRRDEAYRVARRELEAGRQVYVIYPLVEESEKVDLRAATEMSDHLRNAVFPEYNVALLHGRLKPDEKDRVMSSFARGEVHVLVSTTVIEVGVDVPNATVMLVEHAERFGLSQLHQLRGRIGRGAHASTCVLLYQAPLGEAGRARLDALVDTTDGFVIAERDLALRGPGDFFGTRQSGLPTLRVGDLQRDHLLMEEARRDAVDWLDQPASAPIVDYLSRTWADRFGLAGVG